MCSIAMEQPKTVSSYNELLPKKSPKDRLPRLLVLLLHVKA